MSLLLEKPRKKQIHDWPGEVVLRDGIADFMPYRVKLPDPPPIEQFINYGLPIEEQVFQYEKIPKWVKILNVEYRKNGRDHIRKIVGRNSEYASFISDQWRKREEGIFILIYGRPIWIPGRHWFFLNYYKMNQHAEFRFVDWEYWIWKTLCVYEDRNVHGGIEFTQRQDGKSYREGSDILYDVTSKEGFKAGIQSKTNEDVRALFNKVIVLPWRALPFYFQPLSDSDAYPVREINFRDGESKKDGKIEVESGLNSWVGTRATVFTAFDGYTLNHWFMDEAGKCEEMLVGDALRVVRHSIQERGVIKGKIYMTTTVEMTTKGGLREFKKIWDASNPAKLNRIGQTETGLIPYFKPAYETYVFDQYGHSIIGNPDNEQSEWLKKQMKLRGEHKKIEMGLHKIGGKELVDMTIESIKDPIKRAQQIRMTPRSIREAFRSDPKDCEFDIIKIDQRLDDLRFGNDYVVTGNLYWKDNVQDCDEVIWVPSSNGKWTFKKSVLEWLLQANKTNAMVISRGWKIPGNKAMGIISCDPYKFEYTEESRKSLGTAHAYIHYIPEIDADKPYDMWESDDLFMEYSYRGSIEQFDEDMILSCVFLGMQIAPEINTGDVWPVFTRRGYDKYLKFRDKLVKTQAGNTLVKKNVAPGVNTTESSKISMFAAVQQYIETSAHRCVFTNFLSDCRDVQFNNMSPYDYFVSGGYAIYFAKMGTVLVKKHVEEKQLDFIWEPYVY